MLAQLLVHFAPLPPALMLRTWCSVTSMGAKGRGDNSLISLAHSQNSSVLIRGSFREQRPRRLPAAHPELQRLTHTVLQSQDQSSHRACSCKSSTGVAAPLGPLQYHYPAQNIFPFCITTSPACTGKEARRGDGGKIKCKKIIPRHNSVGMLWVFDTEGT